jgi:serine/threonine-protein kinase
MPDFSDRLRTALSDRYPIERQIGSGGMATVYLAHDLKHNRSVAVKVLRGEYAATVGSERFLREIEVAANMTHPHILPLYDSGEADGFLYYVMPYVEGESLREQLRREGQLPIEAAVQITRQVADALDYAHRQGIVHRDVKPENVLLEEGEPVVADFGIARAISAAGGARFTKTGLSIGTPQYMSPEQALADESLDARTDIYALGCVLYEMLTGEPPFTATSAQAVIARHISEPPPSLSNARPEAPDWLEEIVHKALAKKPDERFSTAEDLSRSLADRVAPDLEFHADLWARLLRRLRRRPALALLGSLALAVTVVWLLISGSDQRTNEPSARLDFPPTNIGILPFRDFSQGDYHHLAEGFTDFLADHLGGVPAITTVSPEVMLRYSREAVPIDSIVERHTLGTLIEGNLIATNEELQVSVRLTNAADRVVIASVPPLNRPRSESPALLQDLADEVARVLRRQLGVEIQGRYLAAGTECAECLELYFEAGGLTNRVKPQVMVGDSAGASRALDKADSLLAVAESRDRDWTKPILGRGWIAAERAQLFTDSPGAYDAECTRVGIGHSERALERDSLNAEALRLRGILRSYLAAATVDTAEAAILWAGAETDLVKALDLHRSAGTAWSRLSFLYWRDGRFLEAKHAAEEALAADAWLFNDVTIIMRLCQSTLDLEEFDEAEKWCIQEGRQRFPERLGFAHFGLLLLASSVGPDPDPDRAWGLADTVVQLVPPRRQESTRSLVLMNVAAVLARAGMTDSALAVIHHARVSAPHEDPRLYTYEANARLQMGEEEDAIHLLARYIEARPSRKEYIAKDWWWTSLRQHPEFRALVE